MARRKRKRKFIAGAVEHPGALDREVGGPAHEHEAKIRQLQRHGTARQKRQANLYFTLRKLRGRRRRG